MNITSPVVPLYGAQSIMKQRFGQNVVAQLNHPFVLKDRTSEQVLATVTPLRATPKQDGQPASVSLSICTGGDTVSEVTLPQARNPLSPNQHEAIDLSPLGIMTPDNQPCRLVYIGTGVLGTPTLCFTVSALPAQYALSTKVYASR